MCNSEKKLREFPIDPALVMWPKSDSLCKDTKSIRDTIGGNSRDALEAISRANATDLLNEGEGYFPQFNRHSRTSFFY